MAVFCRSEDGFMTSAAVCNTCNFMTAFPESIQCQHNPRGRYNVYSNSQAEGCAAYHVKLRLKSQNNLDIIDIM
jgi:hypothetical protein